MITYELIQRTWQIIDSVGINGTVEANQIDIVSVPAGHPLLSYDLQSRKHLLIPIDEETRIIEDKQSAGVHVFVSEWSENGRKQRYIDVVCLKNHLNSLFDLIIFEILKTLSTDSYQLENVCWDELNRWRELLSREPGSIPEKITLIGVWGELIFLRDMVRINPLVIRNWLGPNGARYDFFTGKTAIEVKTSVQRKGRVITVHGYDQLDRPPEGCLYVAIQKIEEVTAGGESIGDLINSLVDLGCDRVILLEKLAGLGLTPNVIEQCSDMRFKRIECRIYHVDDDFPCITPSSFKGDAIPNRVIDISYQLDLSYEPPFPIDVNKAQELLRLFASETV